PFIAQDTKAERDRIWVAWTDCGGVDSCRFWVDFARDPSNPDVLAPVQTFLHEYVESSY
ncbi:hypothetical protein N658DRAFT_392284, partial [Parathielavia hyrcaniae]